MAVNDWIKLQVFVKHAKRQTQTNKMSIFLHACFMKNSFMSQYQQERRKLELLLKTRKSSRKINQL